MFYIDQGYRTTTPLSPFLSQLQGAFFALLAKEVNCSGDNTYSWEYLHAAYKANGQQSFEFELISYALLWSKPLNNTHCKEVVTL
jgi:hypothetical protein